MLSIKQMQCESLSHLILHDTLRLSSFAHSSTLLAQLQLIHTQYDREESQLLQLAYEQRRWVRVLECCEMRERMGRSWGRRWASEEKRWVDLMRTDSKQLADVATLLAKQEEERANEGEVSEADVVVNSDYSVVAELRAAHLLTAIPAQPPCAIAASILHPAPCARARAS